MLIFFILQISQSRFFEGQGPVVYERNVVFHEQLANSAPCSAPVMPSNYPNYNFAWRAACLIPKSNRISSDPPGIA